MRAACALVAAAVLAGCAVEVDGAPCAVPGATADCPGGQACGNDGRCSARALACAATRCAPGTDDTCLAEAGDASGTAVARRCVDVDPVCGRWTSERCDERGLSCGLRAGWASCECPAATTGTLFVSPEGGPAGAPPFATGASSPPACAHRTVTDALDRAGARVRASPGLLATVRVAGGRTYSAASGEVFPLVVPGGVTLAGDGADAPVLLFDAAGAASAALALQAGSSLDRVTVRNGDGGPRDVAIEIACAGGTDPVQLTSVVIDGRGPSGARLGIGLRAAGNLCPVTAAGLVVERAGDAGVSWDPAVLQSAVSNPRFAVALALAGGAVRECGGAGVVARGGRLSVDGARIADNAGRGVDARGPRFQALAVSLSRSRVIRNGDTGVAAQEVSAGLQLRQNTIWGNGATTAWTGGGTSGVSRRAGGIAFGGSWRTSLVFEGNRIYGNAGDQIVLLGPDDYVPMRWGPVYCADHNDIGCYDAAPAEAVSYRGIVAIDVGTPDAPLPAMSAPWNAWPPGAATWAFPQGLELGTGAGTGCDLPAVRLDCGSEDPPP